MKNIPRILIADDDRVVRSFLKTIIETEDWMPLMATNGEMCLSLVQNEKPDLILLDIGLPGIDGFEVLSLLCESTTVPIIMISGRTETEDVVKSLNIGAVDYIRKPFSPDELVARIRARLRRNDTRDHTHTTPSYDDADLSIDFSMRKINLQGNEIRLTPTEYALLKELVLSQGKVLTYRQLLNMVWGSEYIQETNYIHVIVSRLRVKLGIAFLNHEYIITVPRIGYKFEKLPNGHAKRFARDYFSKAEI